MSIVTDKWGDALGIMSAAECRDRLSEIENINLDDFYTNGQKDWDKVVRLGNTHLIKSITQTKDGVDFEIINDKSGYVYLITSEVGRTKIGYARNPKSRFKDIDVASPVEVNLRFTCRVQNAASVEKMLHEKHSHKKIKGEWFLLSEEDLIEIEKVVKSYEWQFTR